MPTAVSKYAENQPLAATPGALYQLWLVALNSKGKNPAGPVQNWTAT